MSPSLLCITNYKQLLHFSCFSYSDEFNGYYYYSTKTETIQWEHPLDAQYKALVDQARNKYSFSIRGQDLSEEASQIDSGIRSLQGDVSDLMAEVIPAPVATSGTVPKMGSMPSSIEILSPVEKGCGSSATISASSLETFERKRFEVIKHTPNSLFATAVRPEIGLDLKNESQAEPITNDRDDSELKASVKGFTLTGKGAMFLKTHTNKKDNGPGVMVKVPSKGLNNAPAYKSILRDTNLNDVRYHPESRLSDQEADDKKIVRFNFDDIEEISRNEAENDQLDSTDEDCCVSEVNSTRNKTETTSESSETPKISLHESTNLTPIFDHNKEQERRTKPLYEETDSESVDSVKMCNRKLDGINPKNTGISLSKSEIVEKSIKNFGELKSEIAMVDESSFSKEKLIKNDTLTLVSRKSENIKPIDRKTCAVNGFENGSKGICVDIDKGGFKLKSNHDISIEQLKKHLVNEFEMKRQVIIDQHRMAEEKLQQNHKTMLEELERDLKSEEELIRKENATALNRMRDKLAYDLESERQRMRETGENHLYEKLRCSYRILDDKYRCLKEKYVRLKTDVKVSLTRRNQRRELLSSSVVGSEAERLSSNKNSIISSLEPRVEGKETRRECAKKDSCRDKNNTAVDYFPTQDDATSISQSEATISKNRRCRPIRSMINSTTARSNDSNRKMSSDTLQLLLENNNIPVAHGRQRKKMFTRLKSASTSRLNSENIQYTDERIRSRTPMENLRLQLQKLEDLEDQFPESHLNMTYHSRYPFKVDGSERQADSSNSELEFFKHRLHLERDSVRRAKESLRIQRNNFRFRQRETKIHQSSTACHQIDQLINEEMELKEMEIHLHRTAALLGEKIIRLKHIEQSLQCMNTNEKATNHLVCEERSNNRQEATISDLSSHSSSGFSSTDIASDTHHDYDKIKERSQKSTETFLRLESLNAEILEIWGILSKHQQSYGMFHCDNNCNHFK